MAEDELDEHPEYMCDAGTMEWNLKMDKKIAFNVGYGAGRFFRALKAFEMYWHAEGMKTAYCGTVILDGSKDEVCLSGDREGDCMADYTEESKSDYENQSTLQEK